MVWLLYGDGMKSKRRRIPVSLNDGVRRIWSSVVSIVRPSPRHHRRWNDDAAPIRLDGVQPPWNRKCWKSLNVYAAARTSCENKHALICFLASYRTGGKACHAGLGDAQPRRGTRTSAGGAMTPASSRSVPRCAAIGGLSVHQASSCGSAICKCLKKCGCCRPWIYMENRNQQCCRFGCCATSIRLLCSACKNRGRFYRKAGFVQRMLKRLARPFTAPHKDADIHAVLRPLCVRPAGHNENGDG